MSTRPFSLELVQIPVPCTVSWGMMAGNDQVRFCSQCQQHVYDLSALTRAEAVALVQEKEGRLCARFYRRSDGMVMTKDCLSSFRAIRRKLAACLVMAAATFLAAIAWASSASRQPSLRVDGRRQIQGVEPFHTILEWIDPSPRPTGGKLCIDRIRE